MSAAIEVHQLNKSFSGQHVVKNLSLAINEGQIYGFLGPNGSGKTTTLRMLCGLITPDSGSGRCFGFDLFTQQAEIKRLTGYMAQRFSLWENLTIRENLLLIARLYGLPTPQRRVAAMMEQLNLTARQQQRAGGLSGGWKQRLALAAALLHQPRLLLLDEPTAGVDPNARREFWQILHQLAQQGVTILVSTHYMDEAERCHQLAYIAWGTLLAAGEVSAIIAEQKLFTWQVRGNNLSKLESTLQHAAGVDYTTLLGNVLHITGSDNAALEQTLRTLAAEYPRQPAATGLEDILSHLLRQAAPEERS
ncbi:multidrug ABC transporter ATP-binding protein [Kosakonia sp. MUSA4]|nr:multidrug ABC transporter ATP-binding protein [Kosakonia sp. MUSA4]